jgi:TP901 family phage tail tape measure protein
MARDLKLEVLLSAIDKVTAPLKTIRQGSSDLARSMKAARDQIRELETAQRKITSFRKLSADMQGTADKLNVAQQRVRELKEQMRQGSGGTDKFRTDFRKAHEAVRDLTLKLQDQRRQLGPHAKSLKEMGFSTSKLGDHEHTLRTRIEAANVALQDQKKKLGAVANEQSRLAKARNNFDRVQRTAGSMAATGAAGLGTAYALSRPLTNVVEAFAPAEDAATQLKASMMGSDGSVAADFEKITRLANQLGDRLPGTTADFQEMMTMLRRQGISAASILGGTGEAAAYLGVQLRMPVVEAAEFAAKMQDATRTTEKDMMGLMDTIQRAYYLGVDSTNMLQGFSKISPVMGVIRKDGLAAANELAPLLVMMDQTGMAGESAGNAFRKVFQGAMANSKISRVLDDLKSVRGIDLKLDFTNGKGEFGGIGQMYAQLDKLKGLTTEVRLELLKSMFGDDSETLQVLNTMMTRGVAGYDEVAAKMKAQADLRLRVNQQLGTLNNTMEAAQGSWTNAMAEFGAAVAPELKGLISWLGGVANGIGAWARENPVLAGWLVKIVAVIAALVGVFGALTIALASVLGPFAMLRYGMTLIGTLSSGALLPILAVIAAIAALGVAAYLVYRNWEPIKAFFLGLWDEIKAGFSGGLSGILALLVNFSPLGMFYRAFAGVMSYFGIELPGRFTDFGGMILQGVVSGIRNGLGLVKSAISGAGEAAIGWFKEKLGIHSPSRVFADLGGYTMAGLEQGIVAGQRGPLSAVAGMGKQLAAAGALTLGLNGGAVAVDNRAPLSAGSTPIVIQGDTIQITIPAASGTDAAALAQQINRILDERERNKAARIRSALYDGS